MDFVCEVCNKNFGNMKNLKRHKKIHDKNRTKHVCEVCNNSYFRAEHLKRHMVSHSEEKKPFKCSICVTRFSNRSHLNRHVKFSHLSKTINCHYCEEKFYKKNDFYRHMFSHTKLKPFACYFPFCKRSYFKQGKLISHINTFHLQKCDKELQEKELGHSKSNILSCDTMETNIGISKELKISDLLDNDVKEMPIIDNKEEQSKRIFFQCPFKHCYKYYTRRYNLKLHVKIKHLKLKEYKCPEEGIIE